MLTPDWQQGKCAKYLLVTCGFRYDYTGSKAKAASCMYFGIKIVALGPLKRVTVRFSKVVINFKEAS
jgi:hypothetical protein